MDGVTILQTIKPTIDGSLVTYGIFGILFGCICLIYGYIKNKSFDSNNTFWGVYLAVFGLIMVILGFIDFEYKSPTYKVIVSDTVSYNEFSSKYKVVKREGKIVTVRLKKKSDIKRANKESK